MNCRWKAIDIDMEDIPPHEDEEGERLDLPGETAAQEDNDTSGDKNMPEHTTQLEDSSNEDEEPLPTVLNLDRASRLGKGKQPHQTQLRNQHPTLDDEFFSIINFNKEIEVDKAQARVEDASPKKWDKREA